ncbi:MAG: hypothetical protein ACT4PL_14040 [Phycisphaerales bacterium]
MVPLEDLGPVSLRELRRSLRELLGTMGPWRRAVEVAERLRVDRSLAWKVWRVAQGPDELPSPKHVPGRAAMETFLTAAAGAGAPMASLDGARQAHARLEEVFRKHAGDRASAEIMLGRFTDEGRSRLEMQLRRDAFRASSHFLGVRARVRHQMDVVSPSPGAFMPRVARMRGYYGMQRTRTDARWVISSSYVVQTGGPAQNYRREALDPGASADGAPLARRFCSPADPPLVRVRSAGHTFVDELGPAPMGEAGSTDVVTAEVISEVPLDRVDHDAVAVNLRTPCERLCYELVVHRSIAERETPTLSIFTLLNSSGGQGAPDPRDEVPILEKMRALGTADQALPAVDVPRHREVTAWMYERTGIDPREYLVYRFEMRFPPIPIMVWARYALG